MSTLNDKAERAFSAYRGENYAEAFSLLQPLAAGGNVEAQCMIGTIYHLGLGVVAPDGSEAVRWYKTAAEGGSPLACNNLWSIFTEGWYGVAAGKDEARKWYDEAKRRGFPVAREFY